MHICICVFHGVGVGYFFFLCCCCCCFARFQYFALWFLLLMASLLLFCAHNDYWHNKRSPTNSIHTTSPSSSSVHDDDTAYNNDFTRSYIELVSYSIIMMRTFIHTHICVLGLMRYSCLLAPPCCVCFYFCLSYSFIHTDARTRSRSHSLHHANNLFYFHPVEAFVF